MSVWLNGPDVLSAVSPRKMLAQFLYAAAATSPTLHCSDPAAANYQQIPDGVAAPWLCTYLAYGCGDPLADNFDPDVDVLAASMCMFAGCNDTDATNFDGRATFNDGSCRYERQGCTDASPEPSDTTRSVVFFSGPIFETLSFASTDLVRKVPEVVYALALGFSKAPYELFDVE